MLAHELAHLAARDRLGEPVGRRCQRCIVVASIVWVAAEQLHSATETAADEASLVVADGPADFGRVPHRVRRTINPTGFIWLGGNPRWWLSVRPCSTGGRSLEIEIRNPWSPPSRRRSALDDDHSSRRFCHCCPGGDRIDVPKAMEKLGALRQLPYASFETILPAGQLFFADAEFGCGFSGCSSCEIEKRRTFAVSTRFSRERAGLGSPRVFAANEAPPDASRTFRDQRRIRAVQSSGRAGARRSAIGFDESDSHEQGKKSGIRPS